MSDKRKILLVYTGGTIGMVQDHDTGELKPFGFDSLLENIPELRAFDLHIDTCELSEKVDSSDMRPSLWKELAELIHSRYSEYIGFVVLHGTDTMAFTASMLSYMLCGLNKAVVFTGSQLPIGTIRTDGKENLITAIEIASTMRYEQSLVPEVSVYFEYRLMRGNRVTKYSAEHFDAFHSPNYPALAEAGVDLRYNHPYLRHSTPSDIDLGLEIEEDIAVLKLFPGIGERSIQAILNQNPRGLILETFGAGNGPKAEHFIQAIERYIAGGGTVLNISQCLAGSVQHGRYSTSVAFDRIGVISGADMTFEAGLTKLMHVLGKTQTTEEIKRLLLENIAGERH